MRRNRPLRVLIADDHQLLLMGITIMLRELDPNAVVLASDNARQLLDKLETQGGADLVVMDIAMPEMDGITGLRQIKARFPRVPVLIYSGHEDPTLIRSCFDLGAMGYLPKTSSTQEVRYALQVVLSGRAYLPRLVFDRTDLPPTATPYPTPEASPQPDSAPPQAADPALDGLTERQSEVFRLMEQGMSNKEIARILDCAENTVKNHVSAVLRTLGVSSRIKAVEAVRRRRAGLPQGKL